MNLRSLLLLFRGGKPAPEPIFTELEASEIERELYDRAKRTVGKMNPPTATAPWDRPENATNGKKTEADVVYINAERHRRSLGPNGGRR